MGLFLRKFFKIVFYISCIYLLFFWTSNYLLNTVYSNNFTGFVVDKYNAVNKERNERALIIMGGSNSIYSINSELLEEELNIKVINSGFVYNTGYEFQMNFLNKFSKKGDVILYLPEYSLYFGNGKYGANFLNNTILTEPNYFNILGFYNTFNYFKNGYKSTMQPILNYSQNIEFTTEIKRTNFNSYGDLTYHLGKKSDLDKVRSYSIVERAEISNIFMKDIANLNSTVIKRDARLFISYPIYSKNFVSKDFIKLTDSLVHNNSIFIGNLKDNLFEDEMFYDSPFHALDSARNSYTKNLIKYLKDVI